MSARPSLHDALTRSEAPAAVAEREPPPAQRPRRPRQEAPQEPAETPYRQPGREGRANITGYFPPAVKRQLRRIAVDRDTTIEDLLAEALNDFFAKNKLPEIAPRRQRKGQ